MFNLYSSECTLFVGTCGGNNIRNYEKSSVQVKTNWSLRQYFDVKAHVFVKTVILKLV